MLKKLLILNINSECYSNINTSIIKRKVYSIKQFFVKIYLNSGLPQNLESWKNLEFDT